MLTFRVDETNFDACERAGVRIVTGAGLKVDFDEFAPDAAALGLWHLHDGACAGEGTGLADASGNGHDLTNYGATAVEDGYRLVADELDYLTATIGWRTTQAQVTVEFWVDQCRRRWTRRPGSCGTRSATPTASTSKRSARPARRTRMSRPT
jgi:hypothetical protein